MKFSMAMSSLRSSLVIPGAAIMLVLSLGLIGVGYWSGNAIVNTMSEQLIRHMTTSIHDHVGIMMDAPSRMLTRVQNSVAQHRVALTDPQALAAELYSLLRDEPDVDWLYFANEAGGIVSAGRLADGTRVFLMTDKFRAGVIREYNASSSGRMTTPRKSTPYFDPRLKDWYRTAKETRMLFWTQAYTGAVEPILGISISAPVVGKEGKFAGVYGLDLILTHLSDFMGRQRLGNTGRAFLIDGDGYLIASSGGVLPVVVDAEGRQQRLHPEDARDPVVSATARYLSRHSGIVGSGKAGMQSFVFQEAGLGRIFAAVEFYELSNGNSWLIVSALPASDFIDAVRKAGYLSLVLSAVLVLASLAVGFWTVGRALRPVYSLTAAAHVIAAGGWPDVPETRRNDEIGVLARALGKMMRSLQKAHDELEQKVTERTRELSDANARLKDLDRLKSMFIASMSHELRTPLNSMIGFSSTLLAGWFGPLNEEQKENIEVILRSSRHLLALINDVIDVSKIEAGKVETFIEDFDIYDVTGEAVAPFEKDIKEKGLELKTDRSHQQMHTDRRRLLQCVLNLISNAVKFTEKGSVSVSVRLAKDEGRRMRDEKDFASLVPASEASGHPSTVEISVEDTGIGIKEADIPKLFNPFVRIEFPVKVPGTGLGLYLTRKLTAEILKGEIFCTSAYGLGSRFTIRMPVRI